MKKTILSPEDIKDIIQLYTNKIISSTHLLAKNFKTTHKNISHILKENNITINNKGGQQKHNNENVVKLSNNKTLLIKCNKTGKTFNDIENKSGALTDHLKITYPLLYIPSSYKRRMYHKDNNRYWYEQYFTIIEIEETPTKKCKYCDWETTDIENKTGCYVNHLLRVHNKTISDYLTEYPEETVYHPVEFKRKQREISMTNEDDFLVCAICGEKMKTINNKHLETHNILPYEYKLKYCVNSLMSNKLTQIHGKRLRDYNEINTGKTFQSKDENEIKTLIINEGFEIIPNDRKILKGKEIDIVIPSLKMGIEYNGNKFHTEYYGGKYPNFHLDKLVVANQNGYQLLHIFEDEWVNNKELVTNKIKHLLGKSSGNKIGARKCIIKEISNKEKDDFLNKYHIQGCDKSLIKYGAYYNDILVGVMTFKFITPIEYELNRFSTNFEYIIPGLASKILKQFIKTYGAKKIISFADRRWTLNSNDNLYTKLGFELVDITKPDYRYYNTKIDRYKRFHKYNFRRSNLHKKYGLSMDLTEKEMTKQLGYDRIWDCGLFKYVLTIDK